MEQTGNNVIETTATEMKQNSTKTSAMMKINKILTNRGVRIAAAAAITAGAVAKIVVTVKNHNEETTEEV